MEVIKMSIEEVNKELHTMKEYARNNNVPIMQDEGIDFVKNFIEKKNITNILEIGTAIGYSAIIMCLVNKDVVVTTIERDETRYMEALKNIKKFGLDDRITLIFKDALGVNIKGKFDLIFLCRSDTWTPPHLDPYFDELYQILTNNFEGGIIDPQITKPRDFEEIKRNAEEYSKQIETLHKLNHQKKG
jgi:predicted O-methyltransferase YrrM